MRKIALTFLCLILVPLGLQAQKSPSDLSTAHAAALNTFLTKHPDLEFLSEREMDKGILNDMRKNFGPRLTPYYRTGDFNYDGIQDFAIILASPAEDLGPGLAKTHRYNHDIAVVVFNGQKNGEYQAAFVQNTKAPYVCFLNTTNAKRKRLYFAVYETDEHFFISPVGNAYAVRDN